MFFYNSKSSLMQDYEELSALTTIINQQRGSTVYGHMQRPLGKNRSSEAFR